MDIVVVDIFVNLSDDELNRFERKTNRPKDAFVSKLAVISFMECNAEIDNWPDRELIPRPGYGSVIGKSTQRREDTR